MKSKIFPAFLVFSCFFFSVSIALPAEIEGTDYKRTLFNVENPADPILTNRIIKKIQRNDHTAKISWNPRQKNLYIIHHKSLSTRELERIIADLGIYVHTVNQYTYPGNKTALMPRSLITSVGSYRNCGATKTAWKSLLRKYFHLKAHYSECGKLKFLPRNFLKSE